ncbi:hypothetical protein BHE90_017518, partial [Fusarium euwallaceae]
MPGSSGSIIELYLHNFQRHHGRLAPPHCPKTEGQGGAADHSWSPVVNITTAACTPNVVDFDSGQAVL